MPLFSFQHGYFERDLDGDDPNDSPELLRGAAVGFQIRDTSVPINAYGWLWVLVTNDAGAVEWAPVGTGAGSGITPTVPTAYPYTTLDTDQFIEVDTTEERTIVLNDGTTRVWLVIADAADLSSSNPITIELENSAKTLNGTVDGTFSISANGAQRGFWRSANGAWHGGT